MIVNAKTNAQKAAQLALCLEPLPSALLNCPSVWEETTQYKFSLVLEQRVETLLQGNLWLNSTAWCVFFSVSSAAVGGVLTLCVQDGFMHICATAAMMIPTMATKWALFGADFSLGGYWVVMSCFLLVLSIIPKYTYMVCVCVCVRTWTRPKKKKKHAIDRICFPSVWCIKVSSCFSMKQSHLSRHIIYHIICCETFRNSFVQWNLFRGKCTLCISSFVNDDRVV